MRSSNKIKGLLTGTLVALFAVSSAFAQEYDDMYFTGKDRKKIETEKKARQDSLKKAEEELLSKNVNPDYMDRLGQENDWEGEDGAYYDENYVEDLVENSDRPVTINNYYGYPAGTLDDIYWSDPMLYRYTIFDPFYRSRMRFYNSWYGFNPYNAFFYDPFWGGSRVRFVSSWGYRPYVSYYCGWATYDPFFYDSFYYGGWSYRSYAYGWGYGGWGYSYGAPYRGYYNYPGYYSAHVIEDGNIRRGRRDNRSSSYGRYAGTSGVNTNDGRRPGGGRIDSDTPIRTRRTTGTTDSRGISSGRSDNTTLTTRGTSGVRTTSRSYNSYENRNMRSYTDRVVRSNGNTNVSNRNVRPNYSRTNTISTDRSRSNYTPNVDRSTGTYNVNRTNTGTSYNRSNYVRNNRSFNNVNSSSTRVRSYGNNSSLNRSNTSSYHRSTRTYNSGYNNSRTNSFRGNSSSRSNYTPSFNSGSSSRGSSFSSGSRSSSSSRSSGSRSSSSGSSRTSSRRGGN